MNYDIDFLSYKKAFPPVAETTRLQKYVSNRKLWGGDKSDFKERYLQLFGPEDMTTWQFNFNWYRKISKVFADLLFGEMPVITIGEATSPEQKFLNTILQTSDFKTLGYSATIDLSRFGTAVLKPMIKNNKLIIDVISPGFWFPIFDPTTRKDVLEDYICWEVGETLYVERNTPGQLETRTYRLKEGFLYAMLTSEIVETGVQESLIIPIQNLITSEDVFGLSDYEDIETIVCELETRFSQWSRILDKHSDPAVYGPMSVISKDPLTKETTANLVNKYIGLHSGETAPGYLVWDAQLTAVIAEVDKLMQQLYSLSETSPALFGELATGLANSGTALKRLLLAPLMKASRLRNAFDNQLKQVLAIGSQLAVAKGVPEAVFLDKMLINISWQDGLPADPAEQINEEAMAKSAGLTSTESALQRIWGLSGEALQAEMAKIKEERLSQAVNPPTNPLPALSATVAGVTLTNESNQ